MSCNGICIEVEGERKHGCQRPFHNLQIASWIIHITICTYFIGIYAALINNEQIGVPFYVYCGFLVIFFLSYLYCELSDPSKPGYIYICGRISKNNAQPSRYCRVCKKQIKGLDHHCEWLGTCIGENNYFAFLLLMISGIIMLILQIILSILVITVFDNDTKDVFGSEVTRNVLFGIAIAISIPLASRYFSLIRYHCVLLYKGIGTYDYLIIQRNEELAKRKLEQQNSSL